jgi:hypothetical protein
LQSQWLALGYFVDVEERSELHGRREIRIEFHEVARVFVVLCTVDDPNRFGARVTIGSLHRSSIFSGQATQGMIAVARK